jgi:hypothetical protein
MSWRDTIKEDNAQASGWRATIKDDDQPYTGGEELEEGRAGVEAMGSVPSLGYLSNIQAMAEPVTDRLFALAENKEIDPAPWAQMNPWSEEYQAVRDQNVQRHREDFKNHPKAVMGGMAAGAGLMLPSAGFVNAPTRLGRVFQSGVMGGTAGGLRNPGNTPGETSPLQLEERAENAVKGFGYGATLQGVGEAAGALKNAVIGGGPGGGGGLVGALKGKAEKWTRSATGATEKEARNFKPGTERYLLDNDLIRAGDAPSNIAERAGKVIDAAEDAKGALIAKDLAGATVDRNAVYKKVQGQIDALRGDESKLPLIRKLEAKLEDLLATADDAGSAVPFQKSEQIRRGFDDAARWGSASDAVELEANRIMAGAYREASEEVANAVPSVGAAFKDAKTTQATLIPVRDAAARRAGVLDQSPPGGLLDTATSTVGQLTSGGAGAVAAPIARRMIAPRIYSTMGVGADRFAKFLESVPQLGETLRASPAIYESVKARFESDIAPSASEAPQKQEEVDQIIEEIKSNPMLLNSISNPELRAEIERRINREPSGDQQSIPINPEAARNMYLEGN